MPFEIVRNDTEYQCDEIGTALNYEVISEAITSVRICAEPLTADWNKMIEIDYEKRGKTE